MIQWDHPHHKLGEIRRAGALRCFQVSPRLAGAAQVQMFANTARPPSQPGGGWKALILHCYAWLFLPGESLLSVPESKEALILEERCF